MDECGLLWLVTDRNYVAYLFYRKGCSSHLNVTNMAAVYNLFGVGLLKNKDLNVVNMEAECKLLF
jgi:hypothetical protein